MSKGTLITIIVCFSVVIVLLVGVMVAAAAGNLDGVFVMKPGEEIVLLDEIWKPENLKDIEVVWRSGNVTVSRSDDENVHLKQTTRYQGAEANVQKSGERLQIKQPNSFGFIIFMFRRSDLELKLPDNQYEEFICSISSGNADISGIKSDNTRLSMTSGDFTAKEIFAKKVKATVTSGDMILSGVSAEEEMDVRITSGKISGDNLSVKSLLTDITSGNLLLDGAFNKIDVKATSGKVTVNSSTVPDTLNAGLTSGTVRISIPENNGFEMAYKKTSGKIESDLEIMSSINNDYYVYGTGRESGRKYSVKITSGTFELGKR